MGEPMRTVIRPGDGDARHGTVNGYGNLGCRCDDCREAHRVKFIQHRRQPGWAERHNMYARRSFWAKRGINHEVIGDLHHPTRADIPALAEIAVSMGLLTDEQLAARLEIVPEAVRKRARSGRNTPALQIGSRRLWHPANVREWRKS